MMIVVDWCRIYRTLSQTISHTNAAFYDVISFIKLRYKGPHRQVVVEAARMMEGAVICSVKSRLKLSIIVNTLRCCCDCTHESNTSHKLRMKRNESSIERSLSGYGSGYVNVKRWTRTAQTTKNEWANAAMKVRSSLLKNMYLDRRLVDISLREVTTNESAWVFAPCWSRCRGRRQRKENYMFERLQ